MIFVLAGRAERGANPRNSGHRRFFVGGLLCELFMTQVGDARPAQERGRESIDRVRSFCEWCEINGLSEATGRRILRSGKGPKVIQLSARRIGIRDSDNRTWQDSLVRA
jgi:hypothetical protein